MKRLIILSVIFLVTTIIDKSTCEKSAQEELSMQRRSFMDYLDEEKLRSYLLSFGGNPSAEESRQHMVYKRASGRVRKLKKATTTATPLTSQDEDDFPEQKISRTKNVTITPRRMIKFELEDAKYSAAYEQLKKSRKLRIKRATTDNVNAKNGTYRMERFIAPDTFNQPKELLRFLISDAITSSTTRDFNNDKKSMEEKKTAKRDVSAVIADSSSSETYKKVKITHPLSAATRTKHVSFEELPAKLQKTIESALHDAVTRGKANDGDFLKIYYGDKVIKIPVSLSKHISIKSKETTTEKNVVESYVHKTVQKYPKEEEPTSYKSSFFKETPKYETKYETKYYYPSSTEKAESYVNFVTPKDPKPHVEEVHLPPKKSIYYFSSEEENAPTFESLKKKPSFESFKTPATSRPVIFESSTPSYSTFSDLSKNYESHIIHPTSSPSLSAYKTSKELPRETIPITEDVDDNVYYKPIKSIQEIDHKPIPIPPPTSYIGFSGSTEKDEQTEKNYEFGYHISDYKTGNSYGHQQTKNKDEITGQYSILLPDGRIQTTKYFADDSGFHADVSYSTIHH